MTPGTSPQALKVMDKKKEEEECIALATAVDVDGVRRSERDK